MGWKYMSRVSYEGGQIIIIIEGLKRNGFYYHEANLCTINTEHTISTIVSQNLQKKPANDNDDLEGRFPIMPVLVYSSSEKRSYYRQRKWFTKQNRS